MYLPDEHAKGRGLLSLPMGYRPLNPPVSPGCVVGDKPMTDDQLQREIEELKNRVDRVEDLFGPGSVDPDKYGEAFDHPDAVVLERLRNRDKEPSLREMARLYQNYTDYVRMDSAKQRARWLRTTPEYQEAVDE